MEESNNNKITQENVKPEAKNKKRKNTRVKRLIAGVLVVVIIVVGIFVILLKENLNEKDKKQESVPNEVQSEYRMSGNSLEPFDLSFLQIENNGKNKVYSPLSIKYALQMLQEGANGYSKAQINGVIGDYKAKKYKNSKNMSLANAMFINNNYKDSVKETYTNNLKTKYNAEVIYDSFASADPINNWVSNKTFNLVNKLFDDVSDKNFVLLNALAIDMEWKKVFQNAHDDYSVSYKHENFRVGVNSLESGYSSLDFNNNSMKAKSVKLAAEANRYDIVKTLGEDNIRATVGAKYTKWLADGACGNPESEPDVDTYLNKYIEELNSNYKHLSSSTDFSFYDDNEVKAISKELKEYDGTTLEYIGIMPKDKTLEEYIKNINAKQINTLIDNLKPIELDSFKDGVVTEIKGTIPLFKIEYELKLLDDLKSLGIKDVFDITKADLTGITPTKDLFIDSAVHKANIEFSNEGIKAAAATAMGGKGAAGCWFDHIYEVPVETIDLTFDKPYLYLVRDKASGEVWFTGTVYQPIEYQMSGYMN